MGLVEDLENSIDIVELVSKYTKLKKAGTNYKALCPFPGHNENTPSFVVSPVKQLGYCFGCHRGGGALKFIMDIENVEFKDAIQILASITGKKVEGFDHESYKIKKNIYGLYKEAVNYYTKALGNNLEAQKYLFDRGLKKEDFKKFNFGFSDSGIALYNYLKQKGYDDTQIKSSNIFVNIPSRKDKFIGRIIFPIRSLRGDFVAFTARILHSGQPKYLNSPASDLYDKSEILYGLYEAKKSILEKDFVIVVEGQMDVITCQSYGFTNTVAVSGTALTEKHLGIIKRLTRKIYLSFDGDGAGQKAIRLSLDIIKNKGFEIKILDIPVGRDPDDIIKSGEDFSFFIENALTPIGYYIKKSNFDISSIEDKKKLLSELLGILKDYSDPIEREYYLKEISKKLDIKDYIVYDKFNSINRFKKDKKEDFTSDKKLSFNLEEIAIGYAIDSENNRKYIKSNILFPENIGDDLKNILKDTNFLDTLPLEKKDRLKSISMKITSGEEYVTDDRKKEDLEVFVKKLNLNIYKKLVSELKNRMESGNDEAFIDYSNIVKVAKKNNIK